MNEDLNENSQQDLKAQKIGQSVASTKSRQTSVTSKLILIGSEGNTAVNILNISKQLRCKMLRANTYELASA